jgi:hypothetical protein
LEANVENLDDELREKLQEAEKPMEEKHAEE